MWVDWPNNIPAYLSGLTDRPTYLTNYPSWMTDQQSNLSRLTDLDHQPFSLGWLTNQHTSLSLTTQHTWLYLLGLIYQPTCLNIYPSGMTDSSLSVRIDCPTNIPAYRSGLTDWPIYLTVYPEWLTNQHYWLSGLTDRPTYPPFCLGWLTDKHTWLSTRTEICVLSDCGQLLTSAYIRTDFCLPILPTCRIWLYQFLIIAYLFTLPSYLPIYVTYLSGPTDCLSGPTDWPTSCYLCIYFWADCLLVWLTIMPVFLSCVNYRPTYMPTYLSWLRNIFAFLSS